MRSFAVRATDDVGNVASSAAVSASVDNTPLPSVSVTSPSGGATVSGDVVVKAAPTASDDGEVTRVEFLLDGARFGEDTTLENGSYEAPWRTLDPDLPAFDGAHVLKVVAYDTRAGRRSARPESTSP